MMKVNLSTANAADIFGQRKVFVRYQIAQLNEIKDYYFNQKIIKTLTKKVFDRNCL